MKALSCYIGEERRNHKVFITKNTEYHVRAGQVVAVRSRGSHQWLATHKALSMHVEGHIAPGAYLPQMGPPRPGHRLYLSCAEDDVVTSPVVAILRPPKDTVAEYPASLEGLIEYRAMGGVWRRNRKMGHPQHCWCSHNVGRLYCFNA